MPQQALFLLNSPFIQVQAERLAKRVEVQAVADESRIRVMYRLAYQREPSPPELKLTRRFVEEFMPAALAWERLAQSLLISNEMMFVD